MTLDSDQGQNQDQDLDQLHLVVAAGRQRHADSELLPSRKPFLAGHVLPCTDLAGIGRFRP